jgi:hypothetical protein
MWLTFSSLTRRLVGFVFDATLSSPDEATLHVWMPNYTNASLTASLLHGGKC